MPLNRLRYDSRINAEAPAARQRYFEGKQFEREQKRRDLDEKRFRQQQQQFNDQLAFEREQAENAQDQADLANAISTVGLGVEAYPYAKDAAASGLDKVSGLFSSSAPAAESASSTASGLAGLGPESGTLGYETGSAATKVFPGAATTGSSTALAEGASSVAGLGPESGTLGYTGAAGAESGAGATSGAGSTAGTLGGILAVAALQDMLAGELGPVEGQPIGGVFDFDEGNIGWNQLGAIEPWMEFGHQQWGYDDPTAGAKLTASLKEGDYWKAVPRAVSTVSQWLDPVGEFGYDTVKQGIGNALGLEDQEADIVTGLLDPVHAVTNIVEDTSYICGEANKFSGLSKENRRLLSKMYIYALKKHKGWGRHYFKNGKKLTAVIRKSIGNLRAFYDHLKDNMLYPVLNELKRGDFEKGYQIYKAACIELCRQFCPELAER